MEQSAAQQRLQPRIAPWSGSPGDIVFKRDYVFLSRQQRHRVYGVNQIPAGPWIKPKCIGEAKVSAQWRLALFGEDGVALPVVDVKLDWVVLSGPNAQFGPIRIH